VTSSTRDGEVILENFQDDDYIVSADVNLNSGSVAALLTRYQDANNHYRTEIDSSGNVYLISVLRGQYSTVASSAYTPAANVTVKVRHSGTTHKVWVDGTLEINTTDSDQAAGGLALAGTQARFTDGSDGDSYAVILGYDTDADDAIDDFILQEDFGADDITFAYDDNGNLADDGIFIYKYDPWNNLVKVSAKLDSDRVIGEYRYDAQGRRIEKVVTNSGQLDGTTHYYWNGWQMIEATGAEEAEVIHGTQYIDEVVAQYTKWGLQFLFQDANWNVIAATDINGLPLERYYYTPYGQLTVDQYSHHGDYDGDGDVDATDDANFDTCKAGSQPVTGQCRVFDHNGDGNVDVNDETILDQIHLLASDTHFQFGVSSSRILQVIAAHQGLAHDVSIDVLLNRFRINSPLMLRFVQFEPLSRLSNIKRAYLDGANAYQYAKSNPTNYRDSNGLFVPLCTPGTTGVVSYQSSAGCSIPCLRTKNCVDCDYCVCAGIIQAGPTLCSGCAFSPAAAPACPPPPPPPPNSCCSCWMYPTAYQCRECCLDQCDSTSGQPALQCQQACVTADWSDYP
jgi:RHS repeat-associated protein